MNIHFSHTTRRQFLRSGLLGVPLAWTLPSFLARTLSQLKADAAASAAPEDLDANVLVLVQLAGGNDGLNTVVPYTNDHYYRARPRLSMDAKMLHPLNDAMGLHPNLKGLKALYDAGNVAIIQGAGYPNPNRSHFRSTEIWQTASDADKSERYGWIGRYFDNTCGGCDPTIGINIGRQMPQAFSAKTPVGVSLENPENYRFLAKHDSSEMDLGARQTEDNSSILEENSNSGGTIGSVSGLITPTGSPMDFLEQTALDAQLSSETIRAINQRITNRAAYPSSALGQSLKLVAKLIAGGLPTRIFYVSQGGYDTHANQFAAHQRLLQDLGDSLKSFCEDLKAFRQFSRVLTVTFSEFGRRVQENANAGTDHGAAAPMFVIGQKVKAGFLGSQPSLAPGDLLRGDLKFTADFRAVYAGILEDWLKAQSVKILGRKFPPFHCLT